MKTLKQSMLPKGSEWTYIPTAKKRVSLLTSDCKAFQLMATIADRSLNLCYTSPADTMILSAHKYIAPGGNDDDVFCAVEVLWINDENFFYAWSL